METSASCEFCGQSYTGDKAANQLRGHKMACPVRKKQEKNIMAKTEAATKTGNDQPNLNPNLTADERAIADRVASQDTSWMTITEGDMNDFSLMADPMELPPPAKKAQAEKRFAFHWAVLNPTRIDQLTKLSNPPQRWALCTRSTFPELAPYMNDVLGCVTKQDCALLFKPWHHHEMVKRAKADLNKAYEEGSGISGRKNKIASRDDDVEVVSGRKYKIDGSDQVMGDENDFGSDSVSEAGEAVAG